jgi:iron(III) transport system substrate-binding protein
MKSNSLAAFLRAVLIVALVAVAFYFLRTARHGGQNPLIVYCAHDSVYAESVLREFEKKTGIPVAIRYDTEATKSLGLVELLIREKDAPRCDVFWNNELLGIMDLKEKGVLQPYKGEGYNRIPAAFKDPDGHWTGFAARLRVFIVNTDKMQPTEQAVRARLEGNDLSRVAIAKPLFGTTLTHYSVLWQLMGGENLKQWHFGTRQRNIREVGGNAQTMKLVADGVCDLGFTDTDDYFVAKDEGKPVAMVPVTLEDGSTICIPNTVGIVRGTKRQPEAQRLVDFLLSAETELALARSQARQIPLGPVDETKLSDDVRQLKRWADRGYPLTDLGAARAACLQWLKSEYVK